MKKWMNLWHKYFAHGVGELPEEDVNLVEGPAPKFFAVYNGGIHANHRNKSLLL